MYNVLVCDDDKAIVDSIEIYLKAEGYGVVTAFNGIEAIEQLKNHEIHCAVMDIMMPVMDGITATVKIREESNLPIIFLSAKSEDTDKIAGLGFGADDYVTKPFNPLELLARVKSQIRRYTMFGTALSAPEKGVITTGGLSIDTNKKIVTVDGEQVKLTSTEYRIVQYLMQNLGLTLSSAQIYENVWHEDAVSCEKTVTVHIRRIREKIEINPGDPKYLKVVWGIGYKIEKSDRNGRIRLIACLLAVVFICGIGLQAYRVFKDFSKDNADYAHSAAYVNDVLENFGAKDIDIYKTQAFRSDLIDFKNLAMDRMYFYGNGTREDYERFLKLRKATEDYYIKLEAKNANSLIQVGSLIDSRKISLKKISDCSKGVHRYPCIYSFNDGSLAEADIYSQYIDRCKKPCDRADYDNAENTTRSSGASDPFFDETAPATQASTVVPTTVASYENFDPTKNIPDSVRKKAKNADGVLYFCNYFYENGDGAELYDGYYALTVNRDLIRQDITVYHGASFLYDAKCDTYQGFSERAKEIKRSLLEDYKGFYFAFYNTKKHTVVTNMPGVKANAPVSELESLFFRHKWSCSYDFETGSTASGEYFKDYTYGRRNEEIESWLSSSWLPDNISFGPQRLFICSSDDDNMVTAAIKSEYLKTRSYVIGSLVCAAICLAGLIACFAVLIKKTGRDDENELYLKRCDKMPFILRLALDGGLIFVLGYIALLLWVVNNDGLLFPALVAVTTALLIPALLLLLDFILYTARLIKNRSFLNSLICVKLFKLIVGRIGAAREKRKNRPPVYRDITKDVLIKAGLFLVVPNAVCMLVCFATALTYGDSLCILLTLAVGLWDVFVCIYGVRYVVCLRRVLRAIREIRDGNIETKIDTENMPRSVRAYAQDLSELQAGLKIAVDNAIKEEKMKTELITNVSHDLKTPLTSIINYVDLLSRCNIEDESAKQYLAVLTEKSSRMKKLIDDLVEASKASSGTVQAQIVKVSLNELARQMLGEYDDGLRARGLIPVLTEDAADVTVKADSKMSYRILDNLFGNVKKYAMPGTRIYLTIERNEDRGVIVLRNVSEQPLNISAEELTARFVRGDKSRSSEGSGLGLSIAKSLAELQNAELQLEVAGDMFTARLSFELA